MTDYQIQAPTRHCSATGRPLRTGEKYFTVLLDEQGKFVRKDFSAEAWQGPPEQAFSFWTARVSDQQRRLQIDDELLVDCFQRLESETESSRINFRYVVALLLMRRKRFRFEEVKTENDTEILCLRCAKTRTVHEVLNPRLTEEEITQVQEEVFKVLGWE